MVLRAFRGEFGDVAIRQGRRTVELSPVAARVRSTSTDCAAAIEGPARLSKLVLDAASQSEADARIAGLGIRTEYHYERDMAGDDQ